MRRNTDANSNSYAYTNGNPDGDAYIDTYTKTCAHAEASSHATISPVVNDVKWLGTREKSSRVSQLRRQGIHKWQNKKGQ